MATENTRFGSIDTDSVSGFDVNTLNNTTASFPLNLHTRLSYQAIQASGTFTTAVLIVELSHDDTNWFELSGSTLTGPGFQNAIEVNAKFYRIKVQTAEGVAGTADLVMRTLRG